MEDQTRPEETKKAIEQSHDLLADRQRSQSEAQQKMDESQKTMDELKEVFKRLCRKP